MQNLKDALTAEVKAKVDVIEKEENRIRAIIEEVSKKAQETLQEIGFTIRIKNQHYDSVDGRAELGWGVPKEEHSTSFELKIQQRKAPERSDIKTITLLEDFGGDQRTIVERLVKDYGFQIVGVGYHDNFRVDILICRSETDPTFAAWLKRI